MRARSRSPITVTADPALLDGQAGHAGLDGHASHAQPTFVQRVSVNATFGVKLRRTLEDGEVAVNQLIRSYDPTLADHHSDVARLATGIAQRLSLPADEIRGIGLAASIHDIGTVGMPGAFGPQVAAPSCDPLSAHASTGASIVDGIRFPWPIAVMILQHHERMDGSGFPDGLDGHSLLLGSRVISVADTVVSRTALNPTLVIALHHVGARRGTHFDSAVVDACLSLFTDAAGPPDHAPVRGS